MSNYYEGQYPRLDPSYRGDLHAAEEDGMVRSITRGSQSSAKSWVQYNFPRRPEDSTPIHSPGQTPYHRLSRPLPDPQLYQPQQPQNQQLFQYTSTHDTSPEDEYTPNYPIYPNGTAFHNAYEAQTPANAQHYGLMETSPPLSQSSPNRSGGRSFVGGFLVGLKKKVLGGSSKDKIKRKGTFETEGNGTSPTVTPNGIVIDGGNNTLPRYLSNSSIGPSNPSFAHRLSVHPPPDQLGQIPADSLRHNLAGPQYPKISITPASDDVAHEEHADFYEGPAGEDDNFVQEENTMGHNQRTFNDRVTVIGYGTESHAPTEPPPPRHLSSTGPRVSYQDQLPTRPTIAPTQSETAPIHNHNPAVTSPRRRRHLLNTRPARSEESISSHAVSAAPSYYDPSFSSDLTPIEKFFKGLYNLPWIANERITIDYRPDKSDRARVKKAMKKPKASWYRSVMSRSRRNSLDLLSSGSSSVTSYGNPISSPGSPVTLSPLSPESSRHHHSRRPYYTWGPKPKRQHRKHRRLTTSTTTTDMVSPTSQQRAGSPIVPPMYPYAYPGFPYATYAPYAAAGYPFMPPNNMPQQPQASQPRGPRKHRRTKTTNYPHGYATYQPMPSMTMPPMAGPQIPPIYVIAPSPQGSHNGSDGVNQMYIPMQLQPQASQQMNGMMTMAAGPSGSGVNPAQQQPGVMMQYIPAPQPGPS